MDVPRNIGFFQMALLGEEWRLETQVVMFSETQKRVRGVCAMFFLNHGTRWAPSDINGVVTPYSTSIGLYISRQTHLFSAIYGCPITPVCSNWIRNAHRPYVKIWSKGDG